MSPQRRVKVLFLMIQMGMGGSERLVLSLARHLDRRVFDPAVAWFMGGAPLDEFKALGIPLFFTPKRRSFDWDAMKAIGQVIARERIDVVNAHHFMSCVYGFYGAKVANRARLIYTEHSEADVLSARGKWKVFGRIMSRRCDAIVGISPRVSAALQSHLHAPAGRVRTIENGVDVAVFAGAVQRRAELRRALGVGEGELLIGHVANFRRNKNHIFLLRAFAALAAECPSARLIVVGQGFAGDPENSLPAVETFIRDHGLADRVRLTGYHPAVEEIVGALDVFCLVSYKEGLPLSLVEAMAGGLPVVGTDIEGIRAVVQDGVNGFLVPPDDAPALKDVLSRLARDEHLRRRLGLAGRRLAETRYTLERCVRETQDAFLEAERRGE